MSHASAFNQNFPVGFADFTASAHEPCNRIKFVY